MNTAKLIGKVSFTIALISLFPACDNNDEPDNSMEEINGHEFIDLGLPSGLKWATCNIGATNPEDYGDYFAWGGN